MVKPEHPQEPVDRRRAEHADHERFVEERTGDEATGNRPLMCLEFHKLEDPTHGHSVSRVPWAECP